MYTLGVDIGGTQIRAALVDGNGEIVFINKSQTLAYEGVDPVLERIMNTIDELLKENNVSLSDIKGMGICAPGPINPETGHILSSPNLPGWDNIALTEIIGGKYDVPVFLANDGNAAALGEYLYGNRDTENLVYMTISTGIGGGVILNGNLLLGYDGNAAEVGHMTVNAEGPECGCGNHGCLEAYSSGTGLAKRMAKLLKETNHPSKLRDVNYDNVAEDHTNPLTSKDIIEAAQAGDALAHTVVSEGSYYLGVGLANIINLYNPEKIIFGGGVSQAGDYYLKPAIEEAKKRAMKSMVEYVTFSPTEAGDNIGVLGAAALVDYQLKKQNQ